MAAQNITIPELIAASGVSRNYIYNILSGERSNPSRDKVIAICIGLRASFVQINRALELVKHSALYPRDERDARIAIAVNQGVTTVTEVNLMLERYGLQPLEV
jgi:transcriptional regulator with XRE-family HTH domain